jgi:3-oxoacyl-[acyl-carrier protein] reductase
MTSIAHGRLRGRTALVTGGNTGIGRAVCLAFAGEGADVAVAWFEREEEARSLVGAIEALGQSAHAVRCDVTAEADVEAMFESAAGALGEVDVLVNNAGIQKRQSILDMPVADFDTMLAVHLRGAFLCSRVFARRRIASGGGGRVINLCSQLGYIGRAEYTAYSTAKGGMIAFTRALARELAPHGILVNGVAPGLVDTGFDPLSDEAKQVHAASLPLKRLGTVEDMTSAFVFLASDDAAYYCGQLLHPNGGEIMP